MVVSILMKISLSGVGVHFNANFNFDEMPTKNAQHSEKIWSTEFVVTGLDSDVESKVSDQKEMR